MKSTTHKAQCKLCPRNFPTTTSLRKHFIGKHSGQRQGKWPSFCDDSGREVNIPRPRKLKRLTEYYLWLTMVVYRLNNLLHPRSKGKTRIWLENSRQLIHRELLNINIWSAALSCNNQIQAFTSRGNVDSWMQWQQVFQQVTVKCFIYSLSRSVLDSRPVRMLLPKRKFKYESFALFCQTYRCSIF